MTQDSSLSTPFDMTSAAVVSSQASAATEFKQIRMTATNGYIMIRGVPVPTAPVSMPRRAPAIREASWSADDRQNQAARPPRREPPPRADHGQGIGYRRGRCAQRPRSAQRP